MNETLSKIWRFGGAYILWLITAALGLLDILAARVVVRAVAFQLGADRWSLPAIEKFAFLALGIVWLVLVYLCEHLYQQDVAISMSRLMRRFARVTGIEVGILVLANVVPLLIL